MNILGVLFRVFILGGLCFRAAISYALCEDIYANIDGFGWIGPSSVYGDVSPPVTINHCTDDRFEPDANAHWPTYYFIANNPDPDPDDCGGEKKGNPIDIFTGIKTQEEVDYKNRNLIFKRNYIGTPNKERWTHSFTQSLDKVFHFQYAVGSGSSEYALVIARRDNGARYYFVKFPENNGVWESIASLGGRVKLSDHPDGFELLLKNGVKEVYNTSGDLISITYQDGDSYVISYDESLFTTTVSATFSTLNLVIQHDPSNDNRITRLDGENGQSYYYEYNANGVLNRVIYPDNTPSDFQDNPFRIYHYEHAFSKRLSGISDERGVQYASWTYDASGRAISSEHAASGSGIDKVEIDYTHINDQIDPYVTVTNELGQVSEYHYTSINSVRKVTHVDRVAHTNSSDTSITCAAANQNTVYDSNGYKDLVTDWQGNVTDFDYDDRGLEISRVEAQRWQGDVIDSVVIATPETKTVTTEWHPDLRLPTKITEPDRVTVITYDPVNGRELSRTEYLAGNEP